MTQQRPDLMRHLCLVGLASLMVLFLDAIGPPFAAADNSILQKLEEMSLQLRAAESNRLTTDQKLLALKGCLKKAVRARSESAKVDDKAKKLLLAKSAALRLSQLCTNLECQIDRLDQDLSYLAKEQAAFDRGILDLLSELARHSEKQAEELASRLDACIE